MAQAISLRKTKAILAFTRIPSFFTVNTVCTNTVAVNLVRPDRCVIQGSRYMMMLGINQQKLAPYFLGANHKKRALIDPLPYTFNGGILKILLVAMLSIYVGSKIAQKAATFLEENEIFIHSDDDDND